MATSRLRGHLHVHGRQTFTQAHYIHTHKMSHVLKEKLDSIFFTFICVFVYTYMQMCKHHSAHVEVREHLVEAGPFYHMD